MLESMQRFMEAESSAEGAEAPPGVGAVGFDPDGFLKVLIEAIGGSDPRGGDVPSDGESDDFFSDDDEDTDSDDDDSDDSGVNTCNRGDHPDWNEAARPTGGRVGGGEASGEPASAGKGNTHDSGDEGGQEDAEMLEEYEEAMEEELLGTDVERGGRKEGRGEEGSEPVDVDYDVVKSLLASAEAQGGMPGPLSSMLGSMGIDLPAGSAREWGGGGETEEDAEDGERTGVAAGGDIDLDGLD